MSHKFTPQHLPLIAVRNQVLLPGIAIRLPIEKATSLKLYQEKIFPEQKTTNAITPIFIVIAPILPGKEGNSIEDYNPIACLARVIKSVKVEDDAHKYILTLEGTSRVKLQEFSQTLPYIMAKIEVLSEPETTKEIENMALDLRSNAREFIEVLKEFRVPNPTISFLRRYIDSSGPGPLADFLVASINASFQEQLEIINSIDVKTRITNVIALTQKQIQVLKVTQKIQSNVEGKLSKTQREMYLRQQLKIIKDELGDKDDQKETELEDLQKKIDEMNFTEEVDKVAQREMKRLKKMHPVQAEYPLIKTYLEWLTDLPWNTTTTDCLEIEKARAQLDLDHHGLEKIKKRILQFLAVRKLKNDLKGPILCFVGPPGTGKTSLGRSIADALGRKFQRISLGGVRDEAEIRGHRRTYVGALPGRIIQGIKKAGTNNPVILLDEIDKLGRDVRGDPASALLEVLDPEQNSSFTDHYMSVPFDLSKIVFIATANGIDGIPPPLLDRMELIQLSGYTLEEKMEIAKTHLLVKQLKNHGLTPEDIELPDEVISKVITGYTREAGVRNLEREIAAICRHTAVELVEDKEIDKQRIPKSISIESLPEILGPEHFEEDLTERVSIPGVAAGLAFTPAGGSLLFIEVTKMPGDGKMILTGQLGDVIKESAQTALSWVRSNSVLLGLSQYNTRSVLNQVDIHIHFPSNGTPKDGPSAGVTIATAIVSLLRNETIIPKLAMTGEISLRGTVLPVGGIKEKVLAAHRFGVKKVIIPARNQRDLQEIPKKVLSQLEVVLAYNVMDVIQNAFPSLSITSLQPHL